MSQTPLFIIEAHSERNILRLIINTVQDLWEYRDTLVMFTVRELQIRYKQTVIGFAWVLAQPLFLATVFTVLFGNFMGLKSDGDLPYTIFSMAALLPWGFFSAALGRITASVVLMSNIIKKIYFPRVIIPLSAVLSALVDLLVGLVVLLVLLPFFGLPYGPKLLLIPLLILLAWAAVFGAGMWLTTLNVQFRDVGQIIPFLLQAWVFVSPVAYSSAIVPEQYRTLYMLNPMVGIIDSFRWVLTTSATPLPATSLGVAVLVSFILLVSGLVYFRRMERIFADVI
jgi:lipopolysaccharide transport system permease protein